MIFASFFDEVLGTGCCMFIFLVLGLGWLIKSLGNAMKNETVQTAAKIGFWTWFLSDD